MTQKNIPIESAAKQKQLIDNLHRSVEALADVASDGVADVCTQLKKKYSEMSTRLGAPIAKVNKEAFESWDSALQQIEAYKQAGRYKESIQAC